MPSSSFLPSPPSHHPILPSPFSSSSSSSSSPSPLLLPWPRRTSTTTTATNSKNARTKTRTRRPPPHHSISLSFLPPLHLKNTSISPTFVSIQDSPPSPSSHQEPPQEPNSSSNSNNSDPSNSKKSYIWVNPNSPRGAALRARSVAARQARLAALAASLDACEPAEHSAFSTLSAAFSKPPTEKDAAVVLNSMENPDTAVLALRWFREHVEAKNEAIVYNVTFKVLRKAKRWEATEALWDEMMREGVNPDNVTFSTVISCARFCNLPAKAIEWFEKMPEFGCTPDDVTYSVMIDAYGRAGNVEMALGLYDRARREKWRLDPVICATVIRVHAISGNFDGALNVFEEMKALGVQPNLVIYNTLFDALGRAGRPWQVKTIHKELLAKGQTPTRGTYYTLLRAYSKARYAEDALAVYRQMNEQGMELDVISYNMLLSMCADIGCVNEAEEIFKDMKAPVDGRPRPDSWSYSSLITAYSCSGRVFEAESMLNEMIEAGFKPNIFVLTSLIQCYGKAGRTDDVMKSFDILLELGITPDDRFCGCLLNVATQTRVEELEKVVDCIQRGNAQLGSLVTLLVDQSAPVEVFREVAKELLSTIRNEVKKAYCNCLTGLCVNLNQMEKARVLLDLAQQLEIYNNLQSKSATQWSLHLRGLSVGAALTTLHVWVSDLSTALQNGEELPPLLGIHTGHGKHKYSERGLASMFESHLRELNAPFHEAPEKAGWFLTTSVAAKSWLERMNSSGPVNT